MKAVAIVIFPAILLVIGCAILDAAWYYYILSIAIGDGIGALALLTYMQLQDHSDKPIIKFYESEISED